MFTKKPDPETAELIPTTRPTAPVSSPSHLTSGKLSFLGADLKITGNLESNSLVQIEGTLEGDVHALQIIVGPKAHVTGNVVAEDVTVSGQVDGSVRGLKVTLNSGSRVVGEMHHKSLAIEHGAHFEGHSKRPQDVAELAPKIGSRR